MVEFKVREVIQLEDVLRIAPGFRPRQLVQASLWLAEGDSADKVVDRLQVTQQRIYN